MLVPFLLIASAIVMLSIAIKADHLSEELHLLQQKLEKEKRLTHELLDANDVLMDEKLTPEFYIEYTKKVKEIV